MKIYIDTNIFYNDYFLKNANFKYLFHFIANEGEELLLSKLVCEEVENIRRRESMQSKEAILLELKSLSKLLPNPITINEEYINNYDYNLIDEVSNKCDNINVIDYDGILHSEVVSRALINKKPFSTGEKGYRDTLIWLSLLHYLNKTNCEDDIIFITKNTNDFYIKANDRYHFHPDLQEDLHNYNIRSKITPYDSIFSFVKEKIDKNQHVLDHSKIYPVLEQEGCLYLSELTGSELKKIPNCIGLYSIPMNNLLYSHASIFEGLEDDSLEHSKELNSNEVFVTYSYNLRRVEFLIEIPIDDYQAHKSDIDSVFYDKEIKTDSVLLETMIRPYFNISFIYNTKTEQYKDVSIECTKIR